MSKTKKLKSTWCLCLAATALLSACGQKGPLFLPPKAASVNSPCQTPTSHTITDRQPSCRAA
ncbi:MAG: lipoprotein [Rhodoferax sp.]|nr:lipoprotein [Rhodoferax sp.]MBJ7467285.1 lipoprotein [Rhodoferax sp.]